MRDAMKAKLDRLAQYLLQTLEKPDAFGRSLPMYFVEPHLETSDGAFIPASAIFEQPPKVIILGGAGTGKTTLLRFKAWQAARAFLDGKSRSRCPILIAARGLLGLAQDQSL